MNKRKDENNNKKRKVDVKASMKRKWRLIGTVGALAAVLAVASPEYIEHQQQKKIESNAEIEAIRKFKNIKEDNMGIYLEDTIQQLYKKYPDLDDIIFEAKDVSGKEEFINDIYKLYKAFIVDKSKKEVESMEDVKVVTADYLIFQSDIIRENNEDIIETYKEQYKMITDSFIEAKKTDEDGTKLAKEIYELLAMELGLKDNVLTSQEIQEKIEDEGVYFDKEENVIYTAEGKGHIVLDKEKQQEIADKNEEEQLAKQENDGFEYE